MRRWTARRRPRLPPLSSPLAIRLSGLLLRQVVLIYVLLTMTWISAMSGLLHLLRRPRGSYGDDVRRALAGMWSPGDVLDVPEQSPLYYVAGVANAFVSVLLPLFVLGAFVFKLFRHDPLTWRRTMTVETTGPGWIVLAPRFFNSLTVDVADVTVRAWLRWVPAEQPNTLLNKPLQLLGLAGVSDCETFPLVQAGQPTTCWIWLDRAAPGPDPGPDPDVVDPLFTDGDGPKIRIQGDDVLRAGATIVVIAEGITPDLGEQFRSAHTYALTDGVDANGSYQDITPDVSDQAEWRRFEDTQDSFVFVYGSLMREEDLRAAGLAEHDHWPARLNGWERRWNVASDPAKKDRVLRHPDGSTFDGYEVSLGLERCPDGFVDGVVVKVRYTTLAQFDLREEEYNRTDVSSAVDWRGRGPAVPARVYTYVPKPAAVREFQRRRLNRSMAVVGDYYTSVLEAGRAVGAVGDDFDRVTGLDGVQVLPLSRDLRTAPR